MFDLEIAALTKRSRTELEMKEFKMLRFSFGHIRKEYIRWTAQVGRFGDQIEIGLDVWIGGSVNI